MRLSNVDITWSLYLLDQSLMGSTMSTFDTLLQMQFNAVLLKQQVHMLSSSLSCMSMCITMYSSNKTHTFLHTFNGDLSGTTQVSQYQKGKTNLDFTGARDNEWQWYQLGHMQVCTSLQTENHASTPPLKVFYRPDALPAAQPTASKH